MSKTHGIYFFKNPEYFIILKKENQKQSSNDNSSEMTVEPTPYLEAWQFG